MITKARYEQEIAEAVKTSYERGVQDTLQKEEQKRRESKFNPEVPPKRPLQLLEERRQHLVRVIAAADNDLIAISGEIQWLQSHPHAEEILHRIVKMRESVQDVTDRAQQGSGAA